MRGPKKSRKKNNMLSADGHFLLWDPRERKWNDLGRFDLAWLWKTIMPNKSSHFEMVLKPHPVFC